MLNALSCPLSNIWQLLYPTLQIIDGHPFFLVQRKYLNVFVLVNTSMLVCECLNTKSLFAVFQVNKLRLPDPKSQSDEIIQQQLSHWWKMEICTEAISSLLGKLKGGDKQHLKLTKVKVPKHVLSSIFWRPLSLLPLSIYVVTSTGKHFKRGLFSLPDGLTREGCVCVFICASVCACVSEGGLWEFNGGWCDLRLCAIWSCKAKRLNTARHWVICFLITLHLMWISFVPLKEQKGNPYASTLSVSLRRSLAFPRPHQKTRCVPSWALRMRVWCPREEWGWEAGEGSVIWKLPWSREQGQASDSWCYTNTAI